MFQDLMPGCLQNWCLWNKLECNAKWLMKQVFQTYNSSLICFISASFELWLSTSSACRFVSTVAGVTVVVAMTYTSLISLVWYYDGLISLIFFSSKSSIGNWYQIFHYSYGDTKINCQLLEPEQLPCQVRTFLVILLVHSAKRNQLSAL